MQNGKALLKDYQLLGIKRGATEEEVERALEIKINNYYDLLPPSIKRETAREFLTVRELEKLLKKKNKSHSREFNKIVTAYDNIIKAKLTKQNNTDPEKQTLIDHSDAGPSGSHKKAIIIAVAVLLVVGGSAAYFLTRDHGSNSPPANPCDIHATTSITAQPNQFAEIFKGINQTLECALNDLGNFVINVKSSVGGAIRMNNVSSADEFTAGTSNGILSLENVNVNNVLPNLQLELYGEGRATVQVNTQTTSGVAIEGTVEFIARTATAFKDVVSAALGGNVKNPEPQ